jgi:hypothetical protein
MDEHQAGVDQIKGLCRQGITANVVALDFNMRLGKRSVLNEIVRVDVGDQDVARRATALCKPPGNRSATSANFPALPTWADASDL